MTDLTGLILRLELVQENDGTYLAMDTYTGMWGEGADIGTAFTDLLSCLRGYLSTLDADAGRMAMHLEQHRHYLNVRRHLLGADQ